MSVGLLNVEKLEGRHWLGNRCCPSAIRQTSRYGWRLFSGSAKQPRWLDHFLSSKAPSRAHVSLNLWRLNMHKINILEPSPTPGGRRFNAKYRITSSGATRSEILPPAAISAAGLGSAGCDRSHGNRGAYQVSRTKDAGPGHRGCDSCAARP